MTREFHCRKLINMLRCVALWFQPAEIICHKWPAKRKRKNKIKLAFFLLQRSHCLIPISNRCITSSTPINEIDRSRTKDTESNKSFNLLENVNVAKILVCDIRRMCLRFHLYNSRKQRMGFKNTKAKWWRARERERKKSKRKKTPIATQ